MIYIAIAVLIIVVALIGYIRKSRIHYTLSLPDGEFSIKGRKEKFKIKKGNRFEFLVVDGRIVSCVDKRIGKKPIAYGGNDNGSA